MRCVFFFETRVVHSFAQGCREKMSVSENKRKSINVQFIGNDEVDQTFITINERKSSKFHLLSSSQKGPILFESKKLKTAER